jgi:NAD-reducing hydrogenase large subunit
MRTVTIDPVSRIEGHARITVTLDDHGQVADARFCVTEFRGFEEFCLGRPVWEMPSLTARVCGICPVSHLLASAKTGDALMGVTAPPTAVALRHLANLAQLTQSHALSFFHLSAPDLLLGMDCDPARRNLFGLLAAEPELARGGIRLRSFGQRVIEAVAGRKVHAPGIVPGGVAAPLTSQTRAELLAAVPGALALAMGALATYWRVASRFEREIAAFGTFPSFFLGLANAEATWEPSDGFLRVVDADGNVVHDHVDAGAYRTILAEAANRDSYLKSPYLRRAVDDVTSNGGGVSAGMYRVGPLARLNLCERMGTPLADAALEAYWSHAGRIATSSFFYHCARLVEIVACLERMAVLLEDPALEATPVRADAGINRRRAVGVSEAPRGTLFHDYSVDENGLVTGVNLVIATGQNNLAMGATTLQIAREFLPAAGPVPEGVLNRLEAGIRAYDPCLSCSTHAVGRMPLVVVVQDAAGRELSRTARS